MCGSTNTAGQSCDSVIFPTHNLSYQHVCGRAVGFSDAHPCAFNYYKNGGQNTIDHAYVSGLSITNGLRNGRNHIWIYAGGYQESVPRDCNCPCAANPGVSSPQFVGQDFYCESSTCYYPPYPLGWYTKNTSGMERTATLGAVAVTTLLLRGSGGHSRKRPQRA